MDHIKQLRIYSPENGTCDLIVIYGLEEPEQLSQNGHYLSIDPGLHNLMTCYDSGNGRTFILGRKYLSLERYFHKEIARVQSVWYAQQSERGIKDPNRPRFKQDNIPVTYMQMGIRHEKGQTVCLTVPR